MPEVQSSLLERITIDPNVRFGKACIRGHRITVEEILEWLSGGASQTEILGDYPQLEPDDFLAVYAYMKLRAGRRPGGRGVSDTLEERTTPMTLAVDLQPEVERSLMAKARAKGVSLTDFAQEVLAREAAATGEGVAGETGQALIEASGRMRGQFTDKEIDELFGRTASYRRS